MGCMTAADTALRGELRGNLTWLMSSVNSDVANIIGLEVVCTRGSCRIDDRFLGRETSLRRYLSWSLMSLVSARVPKLNRPRDVIRYAA